MIQPKVLLVEDDPIISKVNGSLLKSLDCDVDFTSSGEDAVNKIARDSDYDLIFMDVNLPGMNGLETCKSLRTKNRKKQKQVPIVFLTSNYDMRFEKVVEVGGNDLVFKPMSLKGISNLLDIWFFHHKHETSEQLLNDKMSFIKRIVQKIENENIGKIPNREIGCLYHFMRGMTIKQIAQTCVLSPRTVESYISDIKKRLHCNTRYELIEKVLEMLS